MKDILDIWFAESYNKETARLKEGTHYKTFEDLMKAKGFETYEHKWISPVTKQERVTLRYKYPENYFDGDIKVLRCIEKVDFDEPDDEGTVECITAAECLYHGHNIVVVLPVVTHASYVETNRVEDTYTDPGYSEGYYELSEDIEVGDEWSAVFSSVDAYKNCVLEFRKLPWNEKKHTSLSEYLEIHSDAMKEYTIEDDSYEENPISEAGEDFYNEYLRVVDEGFETDKGEQDIIDGYHRKQQEIEDEIDRRCGKI